MLARKRLFSEEKIVQRHHDGEDEREREDGQAFIQAWSAPEQGFREGRWWEAVGEDEEQGVVSEGAESTLEPVDKAGCVDGAGPCLQTRWRWRWSSTARSWRLC